MQKESIFYNNNFLVYGFGKSGYASYKFLIKNNSCKIIDDTSPTSGAIAGTPKDIASIIDTGAPSLALKLINRSTLF